VLLHQTRHLLQEQHSMQAAQHGKELLACISTKWLCACVAGVVSVHITGDANAVQTIERHTPKPSSLRKQAAFEKQSQHPLTLWKCLRVALLAARCARTQARPPSRSCSAAQRDMARPWGCALKLTRRSEPPAWVIEAAAEDSAGVRQDLVCLVQTGTGLRHQTMSAHWKLTGTTNRLQTVAQKEQG
jgi:hypothetical protein